GGKVPRQGADDLADHAVPPRQRVNRSGARRPLGGRGAARGTLCRAEVHAARALPAPGAGVGRAVGFGNQRRGGAPGGGRRGGWAAGRVGGGRTPAAMGTREEIAAWDFAPGGPRYRLATGPPGGHARRRSGVMMFVSRRFPGCKSTLGGGRGPRAGAEVFL